MNDHYNRKFSEPGILRQVFRPDRLLIVTFGIAQLFCQPCPGVTDETSGHPPESVSEQVRVDGIVTGRRKYSFTLKGLERDYEVFVPNGTVIGLRLTRPSFDWPNHQLLLTIPISAVDGDAANNKVFKFPLPKPLILTAIFDGSDQKQRAMGADIKRINKFALSSETSPNLKSPLVLQGEVLPGEDGETLQLKTDSASHKIILGRRHGTLSGFSILDLKPNITDVFVTGEFDGEKLYADSIEFAPVGDPLEGEDPNLPRCLFLGDSVSFNYQRPLREALAGNVNLHHPPTNCRGSNNWRAIHRWLGNYTVSGRHWDVITFNFGLDDEKSTKDAYQTNLKRAIEELQKTDAKLIWVTTTPIPFGFLKAAAEPIAVTEQQRAELVKQSES